MGPPIIFIHYGASTYLRRSLRCARLTNPDKRIYLLGDNSNRHLARGVSIFEDFEDFAGGRKERDFQAVFQVIQGERHRFNKSKGVEYWLKFVFRRWFLIENFLSREGIDAFWTFDSDTMILAPLGPREERFSQTAATTQCRGRCLNGWVGSAGLVSRYTDCILSLFHDETFLESQRELLKTHAGLAFNEMDAFCEFQKRENPTVLHAAEVIQGETFDDALAFVDDYEQAPDPILGRTRVKRLWTGPRGGIWARKSGCFVRLLTCNMSWMPDYLWETIARSARVGCPQNQLENTPVDHLRPINLKEPVGSRLQRLLATTLWRIRSFLLPSRM